MYIIIIWVELCSVQKFGKHCILCKLFIVFYSKPCIDLQDLFYVWNNSKARNKHKAGVNQ